MKKIYVVIFMILFLGITSCKSVEKEVVFLRNETLSTIRENSFVNSMKNLNFKFKEVILNDEEELKKYLEKNSGKDMNNKNFIVSEEFLSLSNNNEINNDNLVYINGVNEGKNNLIIDQKHLSYIFGVISGMLTRTNNVSIVYSNNLKDSFENILYFTAGVKKVNLRAYDLLLNSENILDVSQMPQEEEGLSIENFVMNNKSDVVFYIHNNFSEDIKNILNENSKIIFTLNDGEDNPYVKFSYLYDDVIGEIINNNGSVKNYNIGILNNTISINTDNLPEEIKLLVENILGRMANGEIIFPSNMEELKNMIN